MTRHLTLPARALALAAALALLSFPSALRAQAEPSTPAQAEPATPAQTSGPTVPEEVFRDQPPVTSGDVPAVIEFLELARTGSPTEDGVRAIAERHGFDDSRLAYVTTKFMAGMILLAPQPPPSEDVARLMGTPLALPNPEELEVVRTALPDLMKASGLPQ
ncbi:MAG: hypothetical protein LBQ79_10565 [Deltaproteobacteria bacterium]|jgi:hypothetical protein|nr:hypothetical protein [Deltaproteobacteria bacterium]